MLLPALAAAKRKAQEASCINNLKQMVLADILYEGDYGVGIPDAAPDGSTGSWFINFIDYYSKATNLLICPTTSQPQVAQNNFCGNSVTPWCKTDYKNTSAAFPNGPPYFGSYIINGWLDPLDPTTGKYSGDGAADTSFYYLKEAAIKNSSVTPVFSDGIWVDMWPLEQDSACHDLHGTIDPTSGANPQEGSFPGKSIARTCVARHGVNPATQNTWTTATQPVTAGINVSFFDGHVEFSKMPHLWTYYWHANWGVAPNPTPAPGTPF